MTEAADLMCALHGLIDIKEDVHDWYVDAAVALTEQRLFVYAAAMFRAGNPYAEAVRALRAELAELEARYGAVDRAGG